MICIFFQGIISAVYFLNRTNQEKTQLEMEHTELKTKYTALELKYEDERSTHLITKDTTIGTNAKINCKCENMEIKCPQTNINNEPQMFNNYSELCGKYDQINTELIDLKSNCSNS